MATDLSNENNNNGDDYASASASHSNSSSNFTNKSMHLLTEEDFNGVNVNDIDFDNDMLKTLRATKMSHRMRRLLRNFSNSDYAAEIIVLACTAVKKNPCVQILPMPSLIITFPNTSKNCLVATRPIAQGEFIIAPVPVLLTTPEECGRIIIGNLMSNIILFSGLQSDSLHYQNHEQSSVDGANRKRKRNSGEYLQRKKQRTDKSSIEPLDKYCSDDDVTQVSAYDKYDICIDVSDATDEIRAIRRNCSPNCAIRYVILHQRIEVFICARRNIRAGEELTLPHDYDSNFSNKVIQCAHSYQPEDLCLYERERQETIRRYVELGSCSGAPENSNMPARNSS